MDCLLAQQTVSAAADRDTMDAALLAAAQSHCETCPECSRFVRAQVAAGVALPEPPADLADRVMSVIRAEAAAAAPARVTPLPPTVPSPDLNSQGAGESSPAHAESSGIGASFKRQSRISGNAVVAGFAAVVLAGAVGVAVLGTRLLVVTPKQAALVVTTGESATPPQTDVVPQGGAPSVAETAQPTAASETSGTTPGFIVVSGRVYRSEGVAGVDPRTLHNVGTITTSLTSTSTATRYPLRSGTDPDVIYLVDPGGTLVGFRRVKRVYGGQTYYLTSPDLPSVMAWPTLPTTIAQPPSADGSPTFVSVGTDGAGVRVFRPAGSATSNVIIIAPSTGSSDPAAGNPNWTYWVTTP